MRGYRSTFRAYNPISVEDKIVSGLSYLTSGLVGFVWLVLSHIRGKSITSFAKYHIFQSIFLSILLYLAGILTNILLSIVSIIPIIGSFVINIKYFISGYPLIFGYSLLNFVIVGTYFYLAAKAFWGKYGELPWVSDTVKRII